MTNRGVQYRIKAFVPRKEKDKFRAIVWAICSE